MGSRLLGIPIALIESLRTPACLRGRYTSHLMSTKGQGVVLVVLLGVVLITPILPRLAAGT